MKEKRKKIKETTCLPAGRETRNPKPETRGVELVSDQKVVV